jgi:hypothetical protein
MHRQLLRFRPFPLKLRAMSHRKLILVLPKTSKTRGEAGSRHGKNLKQQTNPVALERIKTLE